LTALALKTIFLASPSKTAFSSPYFFTNFDSSIAAKCRIIRNIYEYTKFVLFVLKESSAKYAFAFPGIPFAESNRPRKEETLADCPYRNSGS
jgi:hypothetical protein